MRASVSHLAPALFRNQCGAASASRQRREHQIAPPLQLGQATRDTGATLESAIRQRWQWRGRLSSPQAVEMQRGGSRRSTALGGRLRTAARPWPRPSYWRSWTVCSISLLCFCVVFACVRSLMRRRRTQHALKKTLGLFGGQRSPTKARICPCALITTVPTCIFASVQEKVGAPHFDHASACVCHRGIQQSPCCLYAAARRQPIALPLPEQTCLCDGSLHARPRPEQQR